MKDEFYIFKCFSQSSFISHTGFNEINVTPDFLDVLEIAR